MTAYSKQQEYLKMEADTMVALVFLNNEATTLIFAKKMGK